MDGSSLIWTRNLNSVDMQKYDTARKLIFLWKLKSYWAKSEINDETYLFKDWISSQLYLEAQATVHIMDCQWCNLHDVPYVKKIQPFTLIEVPQNWLHVKLSSWAKFARIDFLLILSYLGLFLRISVDHSAIDLLDDWVDAKSCSLKHRDRVIIVN